MDLQGMGRSYLQSQKLLEAVHELKNCLKSDNTENRMPILKARKDGGYGDAYGKYLATQGPSSRLTKRKDLFRIYHPECRAVIAISDTRWVYLPQPAHRPMGLGRHEGDMERQGVKMGLNWESAKTAQTAQNTKVLFHTPRCQPC